MYSRDILNADHASDHGLVFPFTQLMLRNESIPPLFVLRLLNLGVGENPKKPTITEELAPPFLFGYRLLWAFHSGNLNSQRQCIIFGLLEQF